MKQALLAGLAEILEVPALTEDTVLAKAGNWDSMAVVCAIALIDEKANVRASGQELMKCETAGDVLRLAGVREPQEIGTEDVGDLVKALGL